MSSFENRQIVDYKAATALNAAIAACVEYFPENGMFFWRQREGNDRYTRRWNTSFSGKECGYLDRAGYRRIRFFHDGRNNSVSAHRLAWFISKGSLPDGEIDHINRDKSDNRIENLRDVTRSINLRNFPLKKNNTSGVCGVHLHGQSNKWRASVSVNGKRKSLGLYLDISDAKNAVEAYRAKNGFTDNHGAV